MDEGHCQCLNISLRPIGDQPREVISLFEFISFAHVYREQNVEIEALSKKGQWVPKEMVIMEEVKDGIHTISKT